MRPPRSTQLLAGGPGLYLRAFEIQRSSKVMAHCPPTRSHQFDLDDLRQRNLQTHLNTRYGVACGGRQACLFLRPRPLLDRSCHAIQFCSHMKPCAGWPRSDWRYSARPSSTGTAASCPSVAHLISPRPERIQISLIALLVTAPGVWPGGRSM